MDEIKVKKWTQDELFEHIRLNCKDYSSMVVVAMLYKKLYGAYPKIGMSGQQASFVDSVIDKLPETFKQEKKEPEGSELQHILLGVYAKEIKIGIAEDRIKALAIKKVEEVKKVVG